MRKTLLVALAMAALATPAAAQQSWPTRPISMVVPYGPGSAADVLVRILAPRMSELLGQQIIVENVGGAGGMIGASRVAKAAPDGYQALMGTAGTQAQNQALFKNPSYNGATDFAAVAMISEQPFALIARKDFPAANLREFIAYAKQNSTRLKYGSPGTGSSGHLACALFNSAIGVDITHVPYRGSAQAMTDLIAGVLDYQCAVIAVVLPQLDGKSIKALALMAPTRSSFLPDLPSAAEQGMPGFDASTWNALFLPKATPPDVVAKMNAAAVAAMDTPVVRERLRSIGAEPPTPDHATPEYLQKLVENDIAKWAAPIKTAGISAD